MDKNHVFEQLFHTSLKGQKKDVFSNIPRKIFDQTTINLFLFLKF